MQFDLISDLHIETWGDQQVNWEGLGTSLIAVIAGDISQDIDETYSTVLDISKNYKHVVYLDGNHEHRNQPNITRRREEIAEMFGKYRNITYLYRNTIVLDSTAFIGCNGWYSFDFGEPYVVKQECWHWLMDHGRDEDLLIEQWQMAMEDAEYLSNAVQHCSMDNTIKDIVLVTHTVPNRKLAWFPDSGIPIETMSLQGNSFLENVLIHDTMSKVKVWAFGHLHHTHDQMIDGIRYVSNPRGTPGDRLSQAIYYPKFIKS